MAMVALPTRKKLRRTGSSKASCYGDASNLPTVSRPEHDEFNVKSFSAFCGMRMVPT